MSGILVPDSGTCNILGNIPWEERINHAKNIGVVFGQRSQLWWDVPVIDSFELLKDIYEIQPKEYANNLNMLTETLQFNDFINIPVRQLSLGQRMRCEIAASLLHSPKILFLDEPTIGLDAISKIAVRKFIKNINREKDVTIILTTHDMSDIEALADRILLIGRGNILYNGNLQDLKNKYSTDKIITIEYAKSNKPINLAGVTVLSYMEERAVLSIDTRIISVSQVISSLVNLYEITDVTVESQPVDEIIVKLYEEYAI
jgi:ABC-2 type transport system ATP-binding protein